MELSGKSLNPTPTQLRNARKRRAKKKRQKQCLDGTTSTSTNSSDSERSATKRNSQETHQKSRKRQRPGESKHELDPSLEYIKNPLDAPIIKQASAFFKDKITEFPISLGAKYKWRSLVKLAVRPNVKGKLCVGMFAKTSHTIVPDSGTSPLHHPALNRIVQLVEQRARKYNVKAFSEMEEPATITTSRLKYITASLERSTQKVQLTLIWQAANSNIEQEGEEDACFTLAHRLWDEAGNTQLQSLWVHTHPPNFSKHNNAIYAIDGGIWKTLYGSSHGAQEQIGALLTKRDSDSRSNDQQTLREESRSSPTLYYPPNVFRQANIDAFSKIVREICQYLDQMRRKNNCFQNNSQPFLLELYGGVGTIGLSIAHACGSYLTCSDENPYNRACFERSAASFLSQQCKYVPHNATDMVTIPQHAEFLKKADWIVVDPPRKGLEPIVCQSLCGKALRASVLVYVSCGFAGFQRDYEGLSENGWQLDQASGHVLFPGSDAIETLAIFTRRTSSVKRS